MLRQCIRFHAIASPHDTRCSTACARSAISAFVFCAVAVILFTLLEQRKTVDAFIQYGAFRFDLRTALEGLQSEVCFQKIVGAEGKEKVDNSTLAEVAEKKCSARGISESPQETNPKPPATRTRKSKKKSETHDLRPSPPTNLEVFFKPIEPQRIAELVRSFIKTNNLGLAKRLSTSSKYSIDRWVTLLGRRMLSNGAYPTIAPDNTWQFSNDDFYKFLKVKDVVYLDSFEPPDIANVDVVQAQLRINLPNLPISSDLATGAMLLEFGLLLSVAYFLFYQTEALHSESFPASGTFFAIFNRTPIRHCTFLILTVSPPVAVLLLALQAQTYMEKVVNWGIFGLVVLICIQIAYREGQARFTLRQVGRDSE